MWAGGNEGWFNFPFIYENQKLEKGFNWLLFDHEIYSWVFTLLDDVLKSDVLEKIFFKTSNELDFVLKKTFLTLERILAKSDRTRTFSVTRMCPRNVGGEKAWSRDYFDRMPGQLTTLITVFNLWASFRLKNYSRDMHSLTVLLPAPNLENRAYSLYSCLTNMNLT